MNLTFQVAYGKIPHLIETERRLLSSVDRASVSEAVRPGSTPGGGIESWP